MQLRWLVLLPLLVGTVLPARAADAVVQVVRAAFGTFEVESPREIRFVESARVPLRVDQRYGWVITLDTDRRAIRWREEFTLPQAPATWGPAESAGTRPLARDPATAVTEREAAIVDGLIYNMWSVAAGDPAGRHTLKVFAADQLLATFQFDLQ